MRIIQSEIQLKTSVGLYRHYTGAHVFWGHRELTLSPLRNVTFWRRRLLRAYYTRHFNTALLPLPRYDIHSYDIRGRMCGVCWRARWYRLWSRSSAARGRSLIGKVSAAVGRQAPSSGSSPHHRRSPRPTATLTAAAAAATTTATLLTMTTTTTAAAANTTIVAAAAAAGSGGSVAPVATSVSDVYRSGTNRWSITRVRAPFGGRGSARAPDYRIGLHNE